MGKSSISIRAIYTMAMLVITRWYGILRFIFIIFINLQSPWLRWHSPSSSVHHPFSQRRGSPRMLLDAVLVRSLRPRRSMVTVHFVVPSL